MRPTWRWWQDCLEAVIHALCANMRSRNVGPTLRLWQDFWREILDPALNLMLLLLILVRQGLCELLVVLLPVRKGI